MNVLQLEQFATENKSGMNLEVNTNCEGRTVMATFAQQRSAL